MSPSTFDYRLRALQCPSCGAPVLAEKDAGQVTCQYCSAVTALSAREVAPRAGIRSSLAEETARLSRLKAQLEHPVAGHPYDLTRVPADLESWSEQQPANLAALIEKWEKALSEPPSGVEAQRRACWMSLEGAGLAPQDEALRVRALLESTLGWLEDEGYRHLIRCRLAQSALEAGELEAAEGWLNECDWAPEVLELDSHLRLVRAFLACRRRRPNEVFELLGDERAELPIAASLADPAQRLRIDALECSRRKEPAYRAFQTMAKHNGLETEVARFNRHELAPETVRAVERDWRKEEAAAEVHRQAVDEEKRIQNLRDRLANLDTERNSYTARSATRYLRWLPVGALALSVLVFAVRLFTDLDLLGGVYGYPLCPAVCAECRGPTRTYTDWTKIGAAQWSTGGPQYYCQTPTNHVATLSDEKLESEQTSLREFELGGFSAFMASFVVLLVLLLPFGIYRSLKQALENRTCFVNLTDQMNQLAAELGHSPPPPPSHLASSLRSALISVLGSALLASLLAYWTT